MKQLMFILFLTCSNLIIGQNKDVKIPARIVEVDTLHGDYIAIIQNSKSEISLSKKEMNIIEKLLRESVNIYNLKQTEKIAKYRFENPQVDSYNENFKIDLKKYRRQYFPYLSKSGKEVKVNCFCEMRDDENWKIDKIDVDDGGSCYFHLIIDLKKKKIIKFYTNGRA